MIHLGRYVSVLSYNGTDGNAFDSSGGDDGGGGIPVDSWKYALMTWAITQAYILVNVNRDANGAVITADIQWPDGVNGVLVTDKASDFPGVIDAYRVTYSSDPVVTVTQAAVTRDANGAVINQPLLIIS